MKKVIFVLTIVLIVGTMKVNAQIWKKATEAAKKATEKQVEKRTEKAVDKVFEKAEEVVTGTGENNSQTQQGTNQQAGQTAGTDAAAQPGTVQQGQSIEMTYAKSDFVAGDEIIFEDNQATEKMGEFPSMWDLQGGNAEIVSFGDQKAIHILDAGTITPLMKTPKNYLADEFTIEFDYYKRSRAKTTGMNNRFYFYLKNEAGKNIFQIEFFTQAQDGRPYTWVTTSGESLNGQYTAKTPEEAWSHVSISFNKRAFKLYLNGERIVNIPNMTQLKWATFKAYSSSQQMYFLKNVRIAKGAVPLYDRMLTDGKFITYGITFDVGKSTIKPESMGEINRIVELMTQNPGLKFSVEGHTDSTGNAASNQTLSEARSAAIVAKLVEMGISTDRLTASGKGQNNPIADNGTDEGRAKNRRVEFVKI